MSYFTDKTLLVARALSAKDWAHPNVILAARHMAHEGKSAEEIRDLLWSNVFISTARYRLKKFNIRPLPKKNKKAHLGFETVLSNCGSGINQQSFKPRMKARAA